jgi:hypothetical protein
VDPYPVLSSVPKLRDGDISMRPPGPSCTALVVVWISRRHPWNTGRVTPAGLSDSARARVANALAFPNIPLRPRRAVDHRGTAP